MFVAGCGSPADIGSSSQAAQIAICHTTSSTSNPMVQILVSTNAWQAHEGHGDFIPNDRFAGCQPICGSDGQPCVPLAGFPAFCCDGATCGSDGLCHAAGCVPLSWGDGQAQDPASSSLACPQGQFRNPATCECGCDHVQCQTGMTLDPTDCSCDCPPGTIFDNETETCI